MFSTLTHKGAQAAVMALTAGASDYVGKPTTSVGSIEGAFKVLESELIPKIIGLARRARLRNTPINPKPSSAQVSPIKKNELPTIKTATSNKAPSQQFVPNKPISAVCIGVSTGGPMALMQVFSQIQNPLPVPIFIVQHMPPTFTNLLAARLCTAGVTTVKEAKEGDIAEPGNAYIAPGGFHMALASMGPQVVMHLNTDPPENSCRPAVDVLFRSASDIYGGNLLSVVLTGMGYDGLKGCQYIKARGGQVIAQDEESSVVWGMPGAIAEHNLAEVLLPIDRIADEIIFRTRKISRQTQ
jgi:two-component system chemotaxis response regulator CheB